MPANGQDQKSADCFALTVQARVGPMIGWTYSILVRISDQKEQGVILTDDNVREHCEAVTLILLGI
jgi:hypothetical protein